ncbi:putative DNA (cytosine-5)-methyltransferase 1, replication foci domain-containing protein [Helianthus debilis subsp. tardiflorus]
MASSDDEGETYPDAIMDYVFYDKDNDPISFSKLPVQWNDNESSSANAGPVYLSGFVDNGRRKIYQQVKAWKYDMLTTVPQISVLFKDNHWIKLEKPKKYYENMIRTIFVSVHCLCYLKRKPEAPGKSLWNHLSKVFSSYDVNPSVNDLIDHISFIREAVKRDETLEKSKFLAAFLDNPRKRKSHDENVGTATKASFIVDDTDGETQDDDIITNQTKDSESDEEDDNYDTVCAICDNGGALIWCAYLFCYKLITLAFIYFLPTFVLNAFFIYTCMLSNFISCTCGISTILKRLL